MTQEKSFLRHIQACTAHDDAAFRPFLIDGTVYGSVTAETAAQLAQMPQDFDVSDSAVSLADAHNDFFSRSRALARATDKLTQHYGTRERNEMYPVYQNWGDEPVAKLDRAAVPYFGVHAYGLHVNGYVHKEDGLYIWIGERAKDRPLDPGLLDHIIAGGVPMGLSMRDNLAKEAYEEAGMDERLAKTAKAAGTLTYKIDRQNGLRYDTLAVFDLKLPEDFLPRNKDGEVAGFYLMPAKEVAAIVHDSDKFKFNCNLVLIDFLIRHGILTSSHPGFAAIEAALAPLKGDPIE